MFINKYFYVNIIIGDNMLKDFEIKYNTTLCIFIILLIIITFCILTGTFESSSKKLFKQDVKTITAEVKNICKDHLLSGLIHTSYYTVKDGILNIDSEFKVESKLNGRIVANNKCDISYVIYDDKYMVKSEVSLSRVSRKNINQCLLDSNKLEIGSSISCGKEEFYIIGYDDTNITLFSKYNIDVKNNKQDPTDIKETSINAVAFDETNNRININNSYCTDKMYGCNIYSKSDSEITNGAFNGIVSEDSTIKYYVDNYAVMLNLGDNLIDAGLMKKSKLEELGCFKEFSVCDNTYKWLSDSTYWLETPYEGSNSIVYRILNKGLLKGSYAKYNNSTGVRPVIVIKKEAVKNIK